MGSEFFLNKRINALKYKEDLTKAHWTPTAIECYERNCSCEGCPTQNLFEEKCKMADAVSYLLKLRGKPPKVQTLFEGVSERESIVIQAILDGAQSFSDIAKVLNTTTGSATNAANQLYTIAQNHGCIFSKQSGRLPELIEFIKNYAAAAGVPTHSRAAAGASTHSRAAAGASNHFTDKEKTMSQKYMKFYDEDLNIEFPIYQKPVITAIKEGVTTLSKIAERAQKKTGTTSVIVDDIFKYLVKLQLINNETQLSRRQAIINFIQSRLCDKDYSECGSGSANSFPSGSGSAEQAKKPLIQEPFTEAENKVVELLLNNATYKEAAEKLCISPTTLKTHVSNIFAKRNYHSLQELIIAELKQRLTPAAKPLTESKNSDEITALKNENEKLKSRVRELEQQPPQTFNISGLRLKIQNEIEHLQQKLNALDVFEQEFMRSENAK